MLLINRRKGESILIGENVRLQILKVKGKYVSIGIEASRDVFVARAELLDRLQPSETPEVTLTPTPSDESSPPHESKQPD